MASLYAIVTEWGAVDTSVIDTVAKFPLGTDAKGTDGATYLYVKATGSRVIGNIGVIDNAFNFGAGQTTTTVASAPTKLGVIQQTAMINGQFGWVAIKGPMNVNVKTLAVQQVKLYTSATTGFVDDDNAGVLIPGLWVIATVGGADVLSACMANLDLACN